MIVRNQLWFYFYTMSVEASQVHSIQNGRRRVKYANASSPDVHVSQNGRRRGTLKLIARDQIDRRTKSFLKFDAIASGIAEDLGGSKQLTTVQCSLVEAFAGIALAVNDLNARLLLGEEINITEQSTAVSTMVRVAHRIGMGRIARNIVSDPLKYASRSLDNARGDVE
jgi:hypothetical protein